MIARGCLEETRFGTALFRGEGLEEAMDVLPKLLERLMPLNSKEHFLREYYVALQSPETKKEFFERHAPDQNAAYNGMWLPENPASETLTFELSEDTPYFEWIGDPISISVHTRYSPMVRHCHTFFEMMYMLQGQCIHSFDRQEKNLTEGDICIIAPGLYHRVGVFRDDTVLVNVMIRRTTFQETFFELLSDNSVLSTFFNQLLFTNYANNYIFIRGGGDTSLHMALQLLILEGLKEDRYSSVLKKQLLLTAFSYMLRSQADSIELSKEKDVKVPVISLILNYLQKTYQTATLTNVAEHFNYTPQYLSSLMKKSTGETFKQVLRKIRIDHACNFLCSTSYAVGDISEMVGYPNRENFYRVFKRMMGCTPSEYRNRE